VEQRADKQIVELLKQKMMTYEKLILAMIVLTGIIVLGWFIRHAMKSRRKEAQWLIRSEDKRFAVTLDREVAYLIAGAIAKENPNSEIFVEKI
jgi:uncharacterized membrane protein